MSLLRDNYDGPEPCECGDCRECRYHAELEREARAEYGRSLDFHRWADLDPSRHEVAARRTRDA